MKSCAGCGTGIACVVGHERSEQWAGGNHIKICDPSDPTKPVCIRDSWLLGAQPRG